MLLRLLARANLTPRTLCASDRTGPLWRALFRAMGTPEPGNPFDWPTVDDWVGDLTMAQAHDALNLLMQQEARS